MPAKLMLNSSQALVIDKFVSSVKVQLVNPVTGLLIIKAHISQLKRNMLLASEPFLCCSWQCYSGCLRVRYPATRPVGSKHRNLPLNCERDRYRNIFYVMYSLYTKPGSSVSIVSDYGLDDRVIRVRSPTRAKHFL
jgi:hypothetical protein